LVIVFLFVTSRYYDNCIPDIQGGCLALSVFLFIFFYFHFVICLFFIIAFIIEKLLVKYFTLKRNNKNINLNNKKQYMCFTITIILALTLNAFIFTTKDALFKAFD